MAQNTAGKSTGNRAASETTRDGINLQETSTAELAEIIKQQAESFQTPQVDDPVWSELMKRYSWIGCPKEDRILIQSLDALLRPLNGGRTILPPGLVPVPGAGIPEPPAYYRNKKSLSEIQKEISPKPPPEPPKQTPLVSPMKQNSFSLKKIRSELTDTQKKYLNLIWEHFLDYDRWPETIEFHRDHDIDEVRSSLGSPPLNGSIVLEQSPGSGESYELSLIGILLTKDGEHYEDLRIRLLGFLSQKYYHSAKEERKNQFTDREIAGEIGLCEEDRKILGKIGKFDSIYRTSGSNIAGDWSIEFPRKEIQSIPRKGPFADYHQKIIAQQHHPEWKVFREDARLATADVYSNLFNQAPSAHSPSGLISSVEQTKDLNLDVPDVSFVKDEKLRAFTSSAALQARSCLEVRAYTATAVMAGGAIEAVLLDLVSHHSSNTDELKKAPLGDLINKAASLKLLGEATSTLTKFAQQHRNLIHPGKFLREKRIIDKGDALIIWGIFIKLCEELATNLE